MNMGNYAHGNQPAQHIIYLYNYAGEPWKSQGRVREVMEKMYTPTPDGYCGDEDNGQTSAWYVFSALGFYPVCPASNEYVLGSPLFERATVHLENGKHIVIDSRDNSAGNVYISKMRVNGKEYTRNYLTHDALTKGATIKLDMSITPNRSRGTADEDAPYSFSKE
jgi:predicted alpha-1,2-mannosidase